MVVKLTDTLILPTSSQMSWNDHNIICTILPPKNVNVGIVEYLLSFGKLYYGQLLPDAFKKLYKERSEFLFDTIKKPELNSSDRMNVGFNLYMMRHTQVGEWTLPCLLNNDIVIRGNTRMWATGMRKTHPWEYTKFLEFRNHDDRKSRLNDPIEITSTKQLHEIFGLVYQTTGAPEIEIRLREIVDQESIKLELFDMHFRGDYYSHDTDEDFWLNGLLDWKEKYFPHPQIQIWTDWPELISDSSGIWDIKIAGPFEPYRQFITRPAHIEKCIYMENSNQQFSTHVLYVADPVKIDLGEVLMWLNTDHTVFMEENCSFVLYRPDKEYKTTFISVSKE